MNIREVTAKKTHIVSPLITHKTCQCRACDEVFSSVSVFDKHRIGAHGPERRCATSAEMLDKGMLQKPNGVWMGVAMDIARLEKLATLKKNNNGK